MSYEKTINSCAGFAVGFGLAGFALVIIGLPMALYPRYNVWSEGQAGKAELAKAEYNRQVLVRTAQAQEEAAKYTAQADVTRAEGVAQANKIIGQSLENNKDYLTWKFIDELPTNKNQVIYLPANGELPFTEATRLKK